MSHIYICSIIDMPEYVAAHQPERLVSLVSQHDQPETPPQIESNDHLRLNIADVEDSTAIDAPRGQDIARLVTFVRESAPSDSILFHCIAGISRSPAAALIAMVLDSDGMESEAVTILKGAAPYVSPNRLMIELADTYLGRDRRLVKATNALSATDGAPSFELVVLPRAVG